MIIQVTVELKEVSRLGRNFSWPRPDKCPACSDLGLWGHGFVDAWFDGFSEPIPIKRWRCHFCKRVFRCRPAGFFRRFQAPISIIRFVISHRLQHGRWPPGWSRSRPWHWLRSLKKKVAAYLGNTWQNRLLDAFDHLINLGQTPVSRSI